MYLQLSKNGVVLLSAKTDHDPYQGNLLDSLPVTYEGDLSLLRFVRHTGTASMIVAGFESAELHHKLELSGDYRRCVLSHIPFDHPVELSREWPKEQGDGARSA